MDKLELRQKRAQLIREARAILDRAEAEKRGLTAEEAKRFDELQAVIDWMAREIGGLSTSDQASFEEIEAELRRVQAPVAARREQPGSWGGPADGLRPGEVRTLRPQDRLSAVVRQDLPDGIRAEELSLGRLVRAIVLGSFAGAEAEARVLAQATPGLGGYLVPEPLAARVIDLARARACVIQAGALTVPMEANTLSIAKVASDPVAYWKAENAPATPSDMSFERITLTARTLVALVKMSVELVEDAPNITDLVEQAISQALALELDRAALRGTGTGEPTGIRNWPGVQVIDLGPNGAALTDYSKFSEAVQKILDQNGPAEGLAAIYAPRTAGTLDRFVDSTGQPLRPPASFEALRKFVTTQVPINLTKGTSTNASEAYVGAFRECLIGMRTNMVLEVSREAADADSSAFRNLQVWIRAYLRADVALAQPKHFVVIDGIIP